MLIKYALAVARSLRLDGDVFGKLVAGIERQHGAAHFEERDPFRSFFSRQTKTVFIKVDGPVQVLDAQPDKGDVRFHPRTMPFK